MELKCLSGNSFMGLNEIKPNTKCKLNYKCSECSIKVCKKCAFFKSTFGNKLIHCRSCVLNKWVRSCNDPNLAWYLYTENEKLNNKIYNIEKKMELKKEKGLRINKKCYICHDKIYTNYKSINQKCKKCINKTKGKDKVNKQTEKNLIIIPDLNDFSDLKINPNEKFIFCSQCNNFIELCNCI